MCGLCIGSIHFIAGLQLLSPSSILVFNGVGEMLVAFLMNLVSATTSNLLFLAVRMVSCSLTHFAILMLCARLSAMLFVLNKVSLSTILLATVFGTSSIENSASRGVVVPVALFGVGLAEDTSILLRARSVRHRFSSALICLMLT